MNHSLYKGSLGNKSMFHNIKTLSGCQSCFESHKNWVLCPCLMRLHTQEELVQGHRLIVTGQNKLCSRTRRCLSALRCFTMNCTSFSLARLYAAWLRSGSSLLEHLLTSSCGFTTLSSTESSEKSMVSSLVMLSLSAADWGYFLLTGKPVSTEVSRLRNHVSCSSTLMNHFCRFILDLRAT